MRLEAVVFVPKDRHPVTRCIPRGSAIVGKLSPVAAQLEIYFEIPNSWRRGEPTTLADRVRSAFRRMMEGAAIGGYLIVPDDALTIVGTANSNGEVALTGPLSERAVANWLRIPQLARTELYPTRAPLRTNRLPSITQPVLATGLDPALVQALLERGGVNGGAGEWVAADGRRTSVVDDALIWALESIAEEKR